MENRQQLNVLVEVEAIAASRFVLRFQATVLKKNSLFEYTTFIDSPFHKYNEPLPIPGWAAAVTIAAISPEGSQATATG